MKKILSIILTMAFILSLCSCSAINHKQKFSENFIDLFDTASMLIAYDESQSAFEEKYELFHEKLSEYDKLYDIYHEHDGINNLCTVNKLASIEPVKVDTRIIELLEYGKNVYELSEGTVNICFGSVLSVWHDYREQGINNPEEAKLPDYEMLKVENEHVSPDLLVIDRENETVFFNDSKLKLDVGAIAKGYAASKICEWAKEELWQDFALSLGGNVCTVGFKGDGHTKWNIGIENPENSYGEPLLSVSVNDMAVVTSGDYQRYYTVDGKKYCHIINTETLMPSEYFSAVTVLCSDSALADALSTALFNMPLDEGIAMIEGIDFVEALWVDKDYQMSFSSGFEDYIVG